MYRCYLSVNHFEKHMQSFGLQNYSLTCATITGKVKPKFTEGAHHTAVTSVACAICTARTRVYAQRTVIERWL